jgi:hypothetical protein
MRRNQTELRSNQPKSSSWLYEKKIQINSINWNIVDGNISEDDFFKKIKQNDPYHARKMWSGNDNIRPFDLEAVRGISIWLLFTYLINLSL